MRFKDSCNLFGDGMGSSTCGEIRCEICGTLHNKGADEENPNEYHPAPGFYDLREYDIPKKEFIAFWKLQELLSSCEQARKRGAYKYMQSDLRRVQELSAKYQMMLLQYPIKEQTERNGEMNIGNLDRHCGECGVTEFCGNPFCYCLCTDPRFSNIEETDYKKIAECISDITGYEACAGCTRSGCDVFIYEGYAGEPCEHYYESRDHYCKQIADYVADKKAMASANHIQTSGLMSYTQEKRLRPDKA